MIRRFKDQWPEQGLPVWVWRNGRWAAACLEKGMYPKHDERAKMNWSLLTDGGVVTVHDEDLYVEAVKPDDLPPPGSHGDAR